MTVVLDGAHNGASAEALAATLKSFAAGRSIRLVIGINRDKDARAVLQPLLPLVQSVWATEAADNPRALRADELGRLCAGLGVTAHVEAGLAKAMAGAIGTGRRSANEGSDGQSTRDRPAANAAASAEVGPSVVCITGSLMLVGQARATLGLPAAEQLW